MHIPTKERPFRVETHKNYGAPLEKLLNDRHQDGDPRDQLVAILPHTSESGVTTHTLVYKRKF